MGYLSDTNKKHSCPKCGSEEVDVQGCTPDGTNMNYLFHCVKCDSTFMEDN